MELFFEQESLDLFAQVLYSLFFNGAFIAIISFVG